MKRFLLPLIVCSSLAACGGNDNSPVSQFPQNKDIWLALGGDANAPVAVAKVVDDAAAGLLADPKVAPYFAKVGQPGHDSVDRLKACLRLQFNAVFGGPYTYPGTVNADGGTVMCEDMGTSHADLGIPGCAFDQFVTDLAAVLKADGVPDPYIQRVAPIVVGLKSTIVSRQPVYLAPNTAANCQG